VIVTATHDWRPAWSQWLRAWFGRRSRALATVRLSSDAYGNHYFAQAPQGKPLGVALAVALRLALSCAVRRLSEAANVAGLSPAGPIDREVSIMIGAPVHDFADSPWDQDSDQDGE
jgi:hypothetical protein